MYVHMAVCGCIHIHVMLRRGEGPSTRGAPKRGVAYDTSHSDMRIAFDSGLLLMM